MKRLAAYRWLPIFTAALCLGFAVGCTSVAAQNGQRFDRPALDSMLAPIALYPDRLLSQVLMAATYPEEVEDAARWLRERPGLSGDAAVRSAEGWDWDPSVRSLLAFPLVLDTMASHIRWTADVGEAFLAQREEVMDVIQFLRRRAYAAGTLRSDNEIRVVDTGYAIVIEPAGAQTVYVPYYDPRVIYGTWWWPARPPMYWSRWPGYYLPPGRPSYFIWGPGIHVSTGFFFGDFVWSHREVRVVDVHPYYYPRRVIVERPVVPGHLPPYVEQRAPAPGVWQHDARRRFNGEARTVRRADPQRPPERGAIERRDSPPPARAGEAPSRAPQVVRPMPNVPPDSRQQGGRDRPRMRSDEDRGSTPDRLDRRDGEQRERRGEAPRTTDRGAPAPARPNDPGTSAPRSASQPQPSAAEARDPRVRERPGRERDDSPRAASRAERREEPRGADRGDADGRGRGGPAPQRAAPAAERPSPQQDAGAERSSQRARGRDRGD